MKKKILPSLILWFVLTAAGFIGNLFNISMFFGVDQIFGSIFVLLVGAILGPFAALISALVAHSYTVVLWGHPYALIIFTFEALVVALLLRRGVPNLFIADLLYWLFIGMPLAWLFYSYQLTLGEIQVWMIVFKQPANGLLNALAATLLFLFVPWRRWLHHQNIPSHIILRDVFFSIIMAFVFAASFASAIATSRKNLADSIDMVHQELRSVAEYIGKDVAAWKLNGSNRLEFIWAQSTAFTETLFSDTRFDKVVLVSDNNIATARLLLDNHTLKELDIEKEFPDLQQLLGFDVLRTSHNLFLQTQALGSGMTLIGIGRLQQVRALLEKDHRQFYATLLNQNGQVIVSNLNELRHGSLYELYRQGEIISSQRPGTFHLLPVEKGALMMRWKNSYFVRKSLVDDENSWVLSIEVPFAPYIDRLQQVYLYSFAVMLATVLAALLISILLQRALARTLENLTLLTINLPARLSAGEVIQWPHSRIIELERITVSIRQMAAILAKIFRDGEQRYNALFESSDQSIFVIDSSNNEILDCNHQAEELSGHTHADIIGQRLVQFFSASNQHLIQEWCNNFRHGLEEPAMRDVFLCHATGAHIPVTLNFMSVRLKDRDVILVMLKDVREQRRLEEYLQLTSKVFENTSEAIIITDADTKILRINRAFTEITGYSEEDIIGKSPRILHSSWQDTHFYEEMWQTIKEKGEWQGELWNRRKEGAPYAEWLSISAIYNNEGEITNYIGIFIDITEQRKAQERIRQLAFYDGLTGQPNRTLFMDRLRHAMDKANRNGTKLALLFLDLDNFKTINDTLGHHTGDLLLQAIAHKLRQLVRHSDTFARLGGDEFTLILEDVAHMQEVLVIARKLLDVFKQPFELQDGKELFSSASIGICFYPDDGHSIHDLMRNADIAMYRAKSLGKNSFEFYVSEMNETARQRLELESGLRRVAREGGLSVHFQPQINIATNEAIGVEALIRWNHSEYGAISPDIFIPIAEETGLIVPISEWIFEHCCSQLRAWQEAGHRPLRMAVNLSAVQLRQSGFAKLIASVMEKYAIAPEYIELEITERVLMDTVEASRALNELKAIGITLAIDDFGTGYSSLSYLRKFAIDRLKIAKPFIDDTPNNPQSSEIVLAIINMAHAMKMQVIAEGVETKEQLDFLRQNGCEEYQGYYFSRALPAADLLMRLFPPPAKEK
jgi:diguanylate cyclase (GGDEF)-like protein/PAS domain S-box-containing protein